MKDAKGHGSEARGGSNPTGASARHGGTMAQRGFMGAGVHSSGVEQVGTKPMPPPESTDSRELRQFANNDDGLYTQSYLPVMNNLSKKMDKGVYDPDKAATLWGYHADRAAQAYTKQFGSSGDKWHEMFPPATRREAAVNWERSERNSVKSKDFKLNT